MKKKSPVDKKKMTTLFIAGSVARSLARAVSRPRFNSSTSPSSSSAASAYESFAKGQEERKKGVTPRWP